MTLTFDLLTAQSNQFLFVPNCHKLVNFVTFSQLIHRVAQKKTKLLIFSKYVNNNNNNNNKSL